MRIFHRRHRQRNVGRRQLDLDLRQGRRAHRERHQDGGSRELPCLLQGRGTGAKGGPTITKWTYAWSANGNLTEVRHYNSAGNLVLTVDYSYDAFGEMIQKNDGTVLSRFCQDGWNANMFPSPLAGEGSGVRGPIGNETMNTWAVLNGSNQWQERDVQALRAEFMKEYEKALAELPEATRALQQKMMR